MTELNSSGRPRTLTTDGAGPIYIRQRVRSLGDLTSDHLEALLDPSAAANRSELGLLSPTSTTRFSRGDSLCFPSPIEAVPRITRFVVEQEFEGTVVSVDLAADSFVARLADLTAQEPEEEAEIPFEEISRDDHSLIVPGALFTWVIGLSKEANGQVRRTSEIRFRRFFRFTPRAIARAEHNAAKMFELLNDLDAA